ncbi:unnamed protein product [Lasius platythorax]|uniref:Uncharacterized protein n=1 Tax=Lasius platythorax TaxID=488582 RepID=A0AAV2N8D8_9HYME
MKGALPNLWQNSRKSPEEKGTAVEGRESTSEVNEPRQKGGKMTARLSNGSIYLLAGRYLPGVVDTYIGGV